MEKDFVMNNQGMSNLSDDQLMVAIKDINELQIRNIAFTAFADALLNNIKLREKITKESDLISELEKEDKSFKDILSKLEDRVIKLDMLKDIKNLNDNIGLEYYKALRKEIIKLLKSISAYSTEISVVGEISGDIIYKDTVKNKYISPKDIDVTNFYNSVSNFLMEDTHLLKEKVMSITSVIPVRVTKTKYYDILSKALKKSLYNSDKGKIETILKRYRAVFNGSLESEYGLYFNKYFLVSQECKNYVFTDATNDEIKNLYKKSYDTILEMGRIANIIMDYGIIVNKIIVVNLLKDSMLDDNMQQKVQDAITAWENYNQNNNHQNKKNVLGLLNKFTKDVEIDFNDKNIKLQELSIESFKRKMDINESTKSKLMTTQYALAYLNDYALEKEEFSIIEQNNSVENEYLDQAINNLIQFLDRNIKDMDNVKRKARMRRLLSLTDFPFENPDEFFNYLSNSIEMTSDKSEQFALINKINEIMQSYRANRSRG